MQIKFKETNFPKFILASAFGIWVFGAGCRSHEILPEKIEVKVTRDEPSKDCKLIGPVEGRAAGIKGTSEEALADLKTDAARKGANFVQYAQASALGTALRGTGYFCP